MPRGKKNHRDMSQRLPGVSWHVSFTPFGDRLDFLSPERQQLQSGKLRILPAKERRE